METMDFRFRLPPPTAGKSREIPRNPGTEAILEVDRWCLAFGLEGSDIAPTPMVEVGGGPSCTPTFPTEKKQLKFSSALRVVILKYKIRLFSARAGSARGGGPMPPPPPPKSE